MSDTPPKEIWMAERIAELEAEVLKWKLGCCDREDEAVAAEEARDALEKELSESQAQVEALMQFEHERLELRGALLGAAIDAGLCIPLEPSPLDYRGWSDRIIEKLRESQEREKKLREALNTVQPLIEEIEAIVNGEFGGDWADRFNPLFVQFGATKAALQSEVTK